MIPNPWVIIGFIGFWLASVTGSYFYGTHHQKLADNVASYKETIAQLDEAMLEKDKALRATKKSLDAASERQRLEEAATKEQDQRISDYETELAKRPPAGACTLSDDADVRVLNELREDRSGNTTPPAAKRPPELR